MHHRLNNKERIAHAHFYSYHLSNTPNPPSILLLEARQTCSGATGRNGGHVKIKTASLLSYVATHGPASADEYARFVQNNTYALKHVIEAESIPCEFEMRRSYCTFNNPEDAKKVEMGFKEALKRGDEWTRDRDLVGGEFVEKVTSVVGAKCAVSSPISSFWPYKFVTVLLERAMVRNEGLNVQTETPVRRLETLGGDGGDNDDDGTTLVHTERGIVKAKKVIFATNAYTAALVPEYRGVITPYKGTAAHLAPEKGTEKVFPHLSHTYNLEFGIDPVLETVDYLNPRPDGGIVVGGAKWLYEKQRELWYDNVDDSTLLEPVIDAGYFDGYMQRNFKGWQDSGSKAERIWSGSKFSFITIVFDDTILTPETVMGSTPEGFPHVGKIPGKENQWVLAGFNGGGNATTFLCAKAVAKMVLEGVAFGETGVGVPRDFETTEKRLGLGSDCSLDIQLRVQL